MNWIDLVIILLVIYFMTIGYFQGFVKQVIDLFGLVASFLFALKFYQTSADLVSSVFSIPQPFHNVIGFFLAWFIFEIIYFLAASFFYRKIPDKFKTSPVNHYLGVLPAIIRGVILTAVFLVLILILPIPSRTRNEINNSKVGGEMVRRSAKVESYLENIFGGAINDTIAFFTVKPESDETINLGFKTDKVTIDEKSEQKMLELINEERVSRGLKALVMDEKLRQAARAHSKDMFQRGYFSHTNLEGKSPFDRMREADIGFLVAGENLALAPNVDIAHNGLMNSPGHRANILTGDFGRVGIGVVDGGIYGKMFSQEFTD